MKEKGDRNPRVGTYTILDFGLGNHCNRWFRQSIGQTRNLNWYGCRQVAQDTGFKEELCLFVVYEKRRRNGVSCWKRKKTR
ncbi:MAG: hypothetical protein K6T90_19760, partial [Leptolyngbyaceae cyanobacterium HOT.MB2.61]|nr:hypothetical protein [Leptolyngbyaceae cyanobacterium HOT.MB2.61]